MPFPWDTGKDALRGAVHGTVFDLRCAPVPVSLSQLLKSQQAPFRAGDTGHRVFEMDRKVQSSIRPSLELPHHRSKCLQENRSERRSIHPLYHLSHVDLLVEDDEEEGPRARHVVEDAVARGIGEHIAGAVVTRSRYSMAIDTAEPIGLFGHRAMDAIPAPAFIATNHRRGPESSCREITR